MASISPLADLPTDILVQIFPYLDSRSFLALCSTCKAFNEGYSLDANYWRHATRSTFRVPNQPVVENDGLRWQKLFRRMFTQTRLFTWGDASKYRLGHSRRQGGVGCSFPTEMDHTKDLGVIADMQCGGWSTTLLTAYGTLHTVGVLNGMSQWDGSEFESGGPQTLRFPLPQSQIKDSTDQQTYDGCSDDQLKTAYPSDVVTIRQFSAGRTHILGVSDSGRIWSWYKVKRPALQVKFLAVDLVGNRTLPKGSSQLNTTLHGRVHKVVAGWSCSSAYIQRVGIVLWHPVERDQEDQGADTMLVMEHFTVPHTGFQRTKGARNDDDVGAVLNYIILENYVVFVTDIGKVFCGRFREKNEVQDILELEELRNDNRSTIEVQGSFRRFAIFKNGEVITAHQDYLDACWDVQFGSREPTEVPKLQRIPSLQHNDVISVAFGDYHFLALHSTGRITTYGTELRACGALGLGLPPAPGTPRGRTGYQATFRNNFNVARLRGIQHTGFDHTGSLLRHAYTHGRQVWFGKEKAKWLQFIASGGKIPEDPEEKALLAQRMGMFENDTNVQGEVSEWIEQAGRDWDKNLGLKDDDGLGSHFALSVSAAGWHSGALVLVNEDVAKEVRKQCLAEKYRAEAPPNQEEEAQSSGSWGFASLLAWVSSMGRTFLGLPPLGSVINTAHEDPFDNEGVEYVWSNKTFPRLKLSDGREMPGTGEFDEWRFGRPEWQLDVDV